MTLLSGCNRRRPSWTSGRNLVSHTLPPLPSDGTGGGGGVGGGRGPVGLVCDTGHGHIQDAIPEPPLRFAQKPVGWHPEAEEAPFAHGSASSSGLAPAAAAEVASGASAAPAAKVAPPVFSEAGPGAGSVPAPVAASFGGPGTDAAAASSREPVVNQTRRGGRRNSPP